MPQLSCIHHVGLACADIESTRLWIHRTHCVKADTGIVHDPIQRADLCLLTLEANSSLELVAGPVVESYVRRRQTHYHLCYEVDQLADVVQSLEHEGCRALSLPQPAVLFGGRHVVFLDSPTGLIELLERR